MMREFITKLSVICFRHGNWSAWSHWTISRDYCKNPCETNYKVMERRRSCNNPTPVNIFDGSRSFV